MSYMKLEDAKVQELKEMVLQGAMPKEVSDRFGVAISTVHTYKRKLREAGLEVPNVRGQRPGISLANEPESAVSLRVNGVRILVDKSARTVHVRDTHVEIWF
jgi:transposase